MRSRDYIPAEGCACCNKYSGDSQSVLHKWLKWDGEKWVCSDCLEQAA